MNKIFLIITILLTGFFVQSHAVEKYPQYQILDVGTIGFELSFPIDLNEDGQLLGRIEDEGDNCYFLWDIEHGLSIPDLPGDSVCYYLNNKGQIAGTFGGGLHAFIWDANGGVKDLGKFEDRKIGILGFNDNSQMLITTIDNTTKNLQKTYFIDSQYFLNLNSIVQEFNPSWLLQNPNIPSAGSHMVTWGNGGIHLLNSGAVCLLVSKIEENGSRKSEVVLIKNGCLEVLKITTEEVSRIYACDENGNIIYASKTGAYFFDGTARIKCSEEPLLINGIPHSLYALTPTLRLHKEGYHYYAPGIRVQSLFQFDLPFWGSSRNQDVDLRNSKGWFAGTAYTCYGVTHAYVAIPITVEYK